MQITYSNPSVTWGFAWLTNALNVVLDRLPVIGYRRREARRVDALIRGSWR